jgi:hypothetical protein
MPVILVLAELFGPHTFSVKQNLNLDIDQIMEHNPTKLHPTCANYHDGI